MFQAGFFEKGKRVLVLKLERVKKAHQGLRGPWLLRESGSAAKQHCGRAACGSSGCGESHEGKSSAQLVHKDPEFEVLSKRLLQKKLPYKKS
jgi:hypothetical protein